VTQGAELHHGEEKGIKKVKISQTFFHAAKVQNNFDIFELLKQKI
jgi:hypothetical protein